MTLTDINRYWHLDWAPQGMSSDKWHAQVALGKVTLNRVGSRYVTTFRNSATTITVTDPEFHVSLMLVKAAYDMYDHLETMVK